MPIAMGKEKSFSMSSLCWKRWLTIILGALLFGTSVFLLWRQNPARSQIRKPWKLYWFVPDGLRSEPDLFKIFEWAQKGELPNIARMMREGSYGYSIPVFPSHTPVNFASLFTGTWPARHGVADGPIRIQNYPLKIVPRSGFSSVAKLLDPLWYTLEQAGLIVTLLSVPGSTPPEITRGHVVKGRWGGWGMEFPSSIFHSQEDRDFRQLLGWNDKVFQIEKKLTQFTAAVTPSDWHMQLPQSFSPLREINLRQWDADLFVLLVDRSDDGVENYDEALLSLDKKVLLERLHEGDWSGWFPIALSYRLQRNYQEQAPQRFQLEQDLTALTVNTQARVKIIRLGDPRSFRIRVLYDGLNESLAVPNGLSEALHMAAGPMVDFVDSFPPQLVYFPEDRSTFLEEFEMSFDWHKRAQRFFFTETDQDIFIHSVYSPNQMLTSRWWMGLVDPKSKYYLKAQPQDRERAWAEVLSLYKHIDEMLGEALRQRPEGAYVVLSSDHGAVPLNTEVRLNNFFAQKGWLRFRIDPHSGVPQIDWPRTKVVFLNMNHVFIHPEGLGGNYVPASGYAYEQLRQEVIVALESLRDSDGISPLSGLLPREQVGRWGLPGERVGDLVIANRSGYGWVEDVTHDLAVFEASLKSGYKQAILPDQERGLWTPFIVLGPGVKKGYALKQPISHLQQYPTLLKLLEIEPPHVPDAPALMEIFEKN